jgi:hypothetical protein
MLIAKLYPDTKPYKCEFCDKTFTQQTNRFRHQKKCNPTDVREENKMLKEAIKDLQKRMEKMEKDSKTTTTIINNNTINNNINLNNFTDTPFGSFGGVEAFLDSLKIRLNDKLSFPGIVKDVYFNSAYPENNNIKFIDQEASFIYHNNKWIEEKTLQAISTITKGLLTHMKNKSTVESAKIQWYFSNNPSEKYDFMTNMKILEEAKNKKIKDNDNLWLDIIEMLCNISNEYYKDLILDYQPQTKEIEVRT